MTASVMLAHPYRKSFNHAVFRTVCETLETLDVTIFAHDLYAENFNPVLTETELGSDISHDPLVLQYADELVKSDFIFFIHPNWWGQPPAILKGYIDRVIRPPYAYDFPPGGSGGLPEAKLRGKTTAVFNTSNTEEERENNYFGDPLDRIWKQCVCGFCGIENYHRKIFRIISDSSEQQRVEWLSETSDTVRKIIKGEKP